jgi:hypothetical protein
VIERRPLKAERHGRQTHSVWRERQLSCPLSNHILDAIEERFTGTEQEWAITLRGPDDDDTSPAAQLVPLGELRKALLNGDADDAMKDAVWAELTRLCQERGGDWQLAAIWMLPLCAKPSGGGSARAWN